MIVRQLTAAIAISVALTAAQPAFQLTVDSIMRGPGLVGYEPRLVRWSGNGDRVWFEWKLATDPLRRDFETYEVMRDGSGLRKLTPQQSRLVPPATGAHTTRDRRMTTWATGGDIYVYDHSTGRGRRITSTTDAETNPHLTRDGKRVAFTRSNNLFVLSLEDGSIAQLTDITPPGAPLPPDEKKGTASQEYLKQEERKLIEAVRERAEKKEEDKTQKEKDNPRKPFRPSARQSVADLRLSPDETRIAAVITESHEGARKTIVPNYITETAYTVAPEFRNKVGDLRETRRLALVDVRTGELTWVDAGLKAGATETAREVDLSMPHWSEDGTKAFVTAMSADNKDWW